MNGNKVAEMADQTTFYVYLVQADAQGYYHADGIGADGTVVSTDQAALIIAGKDVKIIPKMF